MGEELPGAVHDIWLRRGQRDPWALQLMIDDTVGGDCVYRRNNRIRRPIAELSGPASTAEYRVLAPEIQLLYKRKGPRAKDQRDFDAVLVALGDERRGWLRAALTIESPTHPWLEVL